LTGAQGRACFAALGAINAKLRRFGVLFLSVASQSLAVLEA
jgi:hypothetical protein